MPKAVLMGLLILGSLGLLGASFYAGRVSSEYKLVKPSPTPVAATESAVVVEETIIATDEAEVSVSPSPSASPTSLINPNLKLKVPLKTLATPTPTPAPPLAPLKIPELQKISP